MTLQLDWPPEIIARLTEEAKTNGLSLDAYLLQTVQGEMAQPSPSDRRKREAAAASIRELRKGNILGPDLTAGGLVDEGRRF